MFIFVLQGLWLYISELAGKELDTMTTIKFIFYSSPKLIPLVVPLTVLLSSIMVFGDFAENYEFAAMKSTGISLQRAMRSLSIFIVLLGFGCFFFANNAIPWGEYNFYNLRRNIAKVKPALAIAEGQFNEIGNINIKVDKKSGDRGQYLDNVVIHQKKNLRRGNYTVIVADKGELKSEEDSNVLKIELKDGNYYDELISKDVRKFIQRKPHAQSTFDTYVINYDLAYLNNVDMDAKNSANRYNMLDITDLNYTIDSLFVRRDKDYTALSKNLYNRSTYHSLNTNYKPNVDSTFSGNLLDMFSAKSKAQIFSLALATANTTSQVLQTNKKTFNSFATERNKHIIALHEKYALGFACIILFFVGAPLGALIRKGGIGLPVVIGVLLFLTYHFIGIAIKNNAKADAIDPVLATWLSTLIMLPLSIYLTSRATNDKGLFDTDSILEPLKKFFKISTKETIESDLSFSQSSDEFKTLKSYDNDKLLRTIKNHRSFSQPMKYKNSAITLLKSRGYSLQELKLSGYLTDEKYAQTLRLKNDYEEDSKLALILYSIGVAIGLLGFILRNNKSEAIGTTLIVIGIIVFIIFNFSLVRSFSKHSDLYKHIEKNNSVNAILFILLGFPLYFIFFLIQKKQINHDLKINSKTKISKAQKVNTIPQKDVINLQQNVPLKHYSDYALTSLTTYTLGVVFIVLFFVFKNNKLGELTDIVKNLSFISFGIYLLYIVISSVYLFKFYKSLDKNKPLSIFLLFLSVPLYPLAYFLLKKKCKQDLVNTVTENIN